MSSPTSLRDLYAAPPDSWAFNAPPANGSDALAAAPSSSYQWTVQTGPTPSPQALLGLASHDDEGLDAKAVAVGLVTAALMQYATAAVATPWEVGKTLLQVQWIPRNLDALPSRDLPKEVDEDEEMSDDSPEEESYFADPQSLEDNPPPRRMTDERGYVIRQSIADEDVIPEYIIPVGSASGTWDMMVRLKSFRPEGWLSLWKGLLTHAVTEILSGALQPIVRTLLESLLSPVLPSLDSPSGLFSPPPLLIPVVSQVITGFILSPLDLVRTRLIVQSSRFPTYSGPIDALKKILKHEGGLHGVYFHPHLFLPTIIDCTLRSVAPFVMPGMVASQLGISSAAHPFLVGCSEWLGSVGSLLVTIPFETVRRRLQVQVRGTAKPLRPCVELRPVPYNGMVDAFWHIVTEERSDIPLKPKRHRRKSVTTKGKAPEEPEKESWMRNTGVGQLYRGLGLRLGASLLVFVLAMTTGRDEPDAGWAEL
ncbi:mitochondrial carrier [Phanerochaete sordida]|uniref:Mitochondrial carrier n=1 Tax=Phanerochaete sordida TaxID=48140 RepID=A0A9P3G0X4_9APHY|nr:mitochondrial carrier [Phanerochaete sordida]